MIPLFFADPRIYGVSSLGKCIFRIKRRYPSIHKRKPAVLRGFICIPLYDMKTPGTCRAYEQIRSFSCGVCHVAEILQKLDHHGAGAGDIRLEGALAVSGCDAVYNGPRDCAAEPVILIHVLEFGMACRG